MTQPRIPAGALVFFGVGAPKKIVCETKRLVLKLSEKGFRGDIYFSNGFYEVGNGCISVVNRISCKATNQGSPNISKHTVSFSSLRTRQFDYGSNGLVRIGWILFRVSV